MKAITLRSKIFALIKKVQPHKVIAYSCNGLKTEDIWKIDIIKRSVRKLKFPTDRFFIVDCQFGQEKTLTIEARLTMPRRSKPKETCLLSLTRFSGINNTENAVPISLLQTYGAARFIDWAVFFIQNTQGVCAYSIIRLSSPHRLV